MKKTQNINLGGLPFLIDEDAFNQLDQYLNAVKRKFSNIEGNNEIVSDIESRIAELFTSSLKESSRSIVTHQDVNQVIEKMGRPEEFEEEFQETEQYASTTRKHTGVKKLYRDGNDKVLGGVISGVTKYFGQEDPTWFRVGFVALPFLDWIVGFIPSGTLFITYIVLWIILPKAISAAEQMHMRGEPFHLDNIHDQVKKNLIHEPSNTVANRAGGVLSTILRALAKIFLAFGIVILLVICFAIVLAFLSALFGLFISTPFLGYLFENGLMTWLFVIGLALLCLAPVIFIASLLARIFVNKNLKFGVIALSTIGAFVVGLALLAIGGGSVVKDFRQESTSLETQEMNATDLEVSINQNSFNGPKLTIFGDDIDDIQMSQKIDFHIKPTKDSIAQLTIKKSARGKSNQIANQRSESIHYNYQLTDGALELDQYIGFDKIWRNQEVDVILRIPENTTLNFDESIEEVNTKAKFAGKEYFRRELSGKSWTYDGSEFFQLDENGTRLITDEIDTELDEEINITNLKFLGNRIGKKIQITEDSEGDRLSIKIDGEEVASIDIKKE